MYLKSLELQGFKSFPDKTLVTFGHDITAIVGPNGSGKSNISDAIRWVMGEQNSRTLRGQRMEDVIFGGTLKRAQVGYAEATLHFDNTDGALRFDAAELMITRRYYRSGESEYYINKQSVRLRDVSELLMDTGLGREGYATISQGRVDEILAAKSTDRRQIFEEAAGISKYRHRKEETERRLTTTQENLLRICDKISELELQVEPLREQAEKAKRYLAYREELKGVEVALWLQTLERLSTTARKAEEDYHSAAFILQQEHDALDKLYQTTDSLASDLCARDIQIDQRREQIAQTQTQANDIRGSIALLQSNHANILENSERVNQELQDQDSRNGGIVQQIASLEQRIAEIDFLSHDLDTNLQEAENEGKTLADSADGMTKQYYSLRSEQEALRAERSGRCAELSAAENSLQQGQERQIHVQEDYAAAQRREQDAQAQLAQSRAALEAVREDISTAQNTIEGYRLRGKTRAERRDKLRKEALDQSVLLNTVTSKLKLLDEMQRDYEGYSKAVKTVMQESARGALRGVHGPVSMLIRTEDAYTIAIEIALGSAMQQIVASDEQCAKAAISFLKRTDGGRATFLPISVIRAKAFAERGVEACRGFVGIASELISCDKTYQEIVNNLLGKTVIVKDMDAAIAIADQFSHRFRIVTLDGQVVNAGGSMTGGSVSRNAGILTRANEIERLKLQKNKIQISLDALNTELAEAERQTQQVEFELLSEEGRLRAAEDEALRLEGEEKQYAVLTNAIGDAIRTSQEELSSLTARSALEHTRKTELQAQITKMDREIERMEAELSVISDGQSIAAQQSNRLSERMTAIRVERAAFDAERTTARDSVSRLQELSLAMQGDRTQRLAMIDGYKKENCTILAQISAQQETLAAQEKLENSQQSALKNALSERAGIEARKTAMEKDTQNKNREILNMERESARLETKKASAEMEEKQIIDRLWETYELTRSSASDAAAAIESVSAAARSAAELKRKISALGTPNLGAIEEFARVNERYEYLTQQRDDVQTSKRDLEGIIRDITTQMTEIFVTEFAKVNTNFATTFVEMFGGGKASLELENPEEPLSCGIEIKVQPPGKQVKTITLLSGGEKAFVAIALYFSILKVRPTPFCILDEIDAALDDSNVERFANYLRVLSDKTQFIVITHRRGTMEASDVLYGVTMQEQGISKILHLDLNQIEMQLGIAN